MKIFSAIIIIVFITVNNVSAGTVIVDASGNGDFTTIQAAVDFIKNGNLTTPIVSTSGVVDVASGQKVINASQGCPQCIQDPWTYQDGGDWVIKVDGDSHWYRVRKVTNSQLKILEGEALQTAGGAQLVYTLARMVPYTILVRAGIYDAADQAGYRIHLPAFVHVYGDSKGVTARNNWNLGQGCTLENMTLEFSHPGIGGGSDGLIAASNGAVGNEMRIKNCNVYINGSTNQATGACNGYLNFPCPTDFYFGGSNGTTTWYIEDSYFKYDWDFITTGGNEKWFFKNCTFETYSDSRIPVSVWTSKNFLRIWSDPGVKCTVKFSHCTWNIIEENGGTGKEFNLFVLYDGRNFTFVDGDV